MRANLARTARKCARLAPSTKRRMPPRESVPLGMQTPCREFKLFVISSGKWEASHLGIGNLAPMETEEEPAAVETPGLSSLAGETIELIAQALQLRDR